MNKKNLILINIKAEADLDEAKEDTEECSFCKRQEYPIRDIDIEIIVSIGEGEKRITAKRIIKICPCCFEYARNYGATVSVYMETGQEKKKL